MLKKEEKSSFSGYLRPLKTTKHTTLYKSNSQAGEKYTALY